MFNIAVATLELSIGYHSKVFIPAILNCVSAITRQNKTTIRCRTLYTPKMVPVIQMCADVPCKRPTTVNSNVTEWTFWGTCDSAVYCTPLPAIEKLLSAAWDVPKEQLPAHFDSLSVQCQALQKFVSDSTVFITSYELRSSQEVDRLLDCVELGTSLANFNVSCVSEFCHKTGLI